MINRAPELQIRLERWVPVIIIVMTGLAFGLRLINLGRSDLTFDEAATVLIARKPLAEMIPYLLHAFHEHPPGYYILAAGWMQLTGDSESMLRFVPVIAGTLSIPVLYRWVKEAIDPLAGIVAALLLSVTPVHIFYSQNARMYTLVGLLALLSWWLVLRLTRSDRRRYWLGLMVCGIVGLLTHYYMGLVLAAEAVYLLVTWRQNKRLLGKWLIWLGTPIALGAIYILAAPGALSTIRRMFQGGLGTRLTLGGLRSLAADMIFGPHGNLGIEVWSVILVMVMIGLGVALLGRAGVQRTIGLMLAYTVLVPLASVAALPEALSVRYVLFLIFPIDVALTIVILLPLRVGLTHRRWRSWAWLPVTFSALMMLGLNISRLPNHYDAMNSNYGHIIGNVRANYQPGDSVIFNGPWQAVQQVYYPIGNIPNIYLPPQTPPALDPQATEPQLMDLLSKYRRVWVIPTAVEQADPNRYVLGWLNEHAYHAAQRPDMDLYYALPMASTSVLSKPIDFGGLVNLSAVSLSSNSVTAGEAVLVELNWRTLKPIGDDVQITLEAIDPSGNVWGQRIYQPGERFVTPGEWDAGQAMIDRQAILIDPGAPPGAYRLRLTVQRASSGEALQPAGQADSVSVVLAPLLVELSPAAISDDRLPGAHVAVGFGDGLSLISYHMPSSQFVQGGVIPVTFYWRAHEGDRNVDVDVTLVDSGGQVIDQSRGPLGPEWYRAPQWPNGAVVATSTALRIPPRSNAGTYHLQVMVRDRLGQTIAAQGRLARPGFLSLWTEQVLEEHDTWRIGDVSIAERNRNFNMPAFQHALPIKFGDQLQLLGYDLDPSNARPGGQLRVKFYWQALQNIDQNLVVFTHLIDANGQQRGQHDSMPVGGLNPTTFWQPDEVIADEYVIGIGSAATPGQYTLDFGWYESDSGTRLIAIGADGKRYRDDIATLANLSVGP